MSAAGIARALGKAMREGKEWRCRCPLHGGRSLTLRNSESGRLLVKCFGGCDSHEVFRELCRLGLLDTQPTTSCQFPQVRPGCSDDAARTARALAIWHKARSITGTIAEKYLASRRIHLADLPGDARANLRFEPNCAHPSGRCFPAMVGLVQHVQRGAVAVHRTFLKPDGSGKANVEPDKASLGPVRNGAVRLGTPRADQSLVVAEGIETAASVAVATGLPSWAALSANGLRALVLPPEARMVTVAADNDLNKTGQRAAREAGERFRREGRCVRIAMPPAGYDMNDILTSQGSTFLHGGCDAAA